MLYDRSSYNRAGVEYVMGYCSGHDYLGFQRMLVHSGIPRFLKRANAPVGQWKLSPLDVEWLARWEKYTKAKGAMLFYTDTADAPWMIVRSDNKRRTHL